MPDPDWTIPRWHPDLGDPAEQVNLLRSFHVALQPGFTAELVHHEPGYMSLLLQRDGREVAEVLVVYERTRPDNRSAPRLGVFLREGDDEEHYFTTPGDAAASLDDVRLEKEEAWRLVKSRVEGRSAQEPVLAG